MGYYDFACPFYPVEWTIAHLKVSDEIKKNNISTGYYEAGHMVYIDSAVGRQIPRRSGEVRAGRIAKMIAEIARRAHLRSFSALRLSLRTESYFCEMT